jgi:hypothetical protein
MEPFVVQPSDLRVFDPAKAKFAKPKSKEEAEGLRDVDNATKIRKEVERSGAKLQKPKD